MDGEDRGQPEKAEDVSHGEHTITHRLRVVFLPEVTICTTRTRGKWEFHQCVLVTSLNER